VEKAYQARELRRQSCGDEDQIGSTTTTKNRVRTGRWDLPGQKRKGASKALLCYCDRRERESQRERERERERESGRAAARENKEKGKTEKKQGASLNSQRQSMIRNLISSKHD
jgi:hypothetical protein